MKFRSLVVAAFFSLSATVMAAPHGIQPADINRDGNACTDFFDYANGAWRKQNPIPDYMDRWSRRWQSGEVNKEHVRSILDEVSARRDWPAGSAEQLSGDFYGACMDESRVNQLGIAPVRSLLDDISAARYPRRRAAPHRPVALDRSWRRLRDLCGPGPARSDADRRAPLRVRASACRIATIT